ncbi:unnamed protein product [Moneuplotes crassus]|uniref:Uncharacterized protein n=1 Tax=Euplotes crassus TaxID=5936 RepID=A0AAD2DAX0_EUPCR|nr:unnamed protein product [Moneuplotes crassus]
MKTASNHKASIFKFSNFEDTADNNTKVGKEEFSKDTTLLAMPVVLSHERTPSFINKLPSEMKETFMYKNDKTTNNFLTIHENIQEDKGEEDKESSSNSSSSFSSTVNQTSRDSSNKRCTNLQPINESVEINSEEPQLSKGPTDTETLNIMDLESEDVSRTAIADSSDRINKKRVEDVYNKNVPKLPNSENLQENQLEKISTTILKPVTEKEKSKVVSTIDAIKEQRTKFSPTVPSVIKRPCLNTVERRVKNTDKITEKLVLKKKRAKKSDISDISIVKDPSVKKGTSPTYKTRNKAKFEGELDFKSCAFSSFNKRKGSSKRRKKRRHISNQNVTLSCYSPLKKKSNRICYRAENKLFKDVDRILSSVDNTKASRSRAISPSNELSQFSPIRAAGRTIQKVSRDDLFSQKRKHKKTNCRNAKSPPYRTLTRPLIGSFKRRKHFVVKSKKISSGFQDSRKIGDSIKIRRRVFSPSCSIGVQEESTSTFKKKCDDSIQKTKDEESSAMSFLMERPKYKTCNKKESKEFSILSIRKAKHKNKTGNLKNYIAKIANLADFSVSIKNTGR